MTTPRPQPTAKHRIDGLQVEVHGSIEAVGAAAAVDMAEEMKRAIAARARARVILASANSQLTFLRALRTAPGIAWDKVDVFHMDEYVGLEPDHPASFQRFLRRELIDHVPGVTFHPISGDPGRVSETSAAYESLLRETEVDAVAMGYGENGHIAFNDPPFADFADPVWVKAVKLDEVSRRQQVGEGHFASIGDVPTHAISLTIPALLSPRRIFCIVPEARKADAVHDCLRLPVSEDRPGSVLRTVTHARLYLDEESARRLRSE